MRLPRAARMSAPATLCRCLMLDAQPHRYDAAIFFLPPADFLLLFRGFSFFLRDCLRLFRHAADFHAFLFSFHFKMRLLTKTPCHADARLFAFICLRHDAC